MFYSNIIDPNSLPDLLIWGNTLWAWIVALIAFIGIALLIKVFFVLIRQYLKAKAQEMGLEVNETSVRIVDALRWPLYLVVSGYITQSLLVVSTKAKQWLFYAFLVIVVYYAVKAGEVLIDLAVEKSAELKRNRKSDEHAVKVLGQIAKVILWILAVLLLLSNFGYNISSLIAGLGIGGVAVAFASQQILADFFGAFTIYFDKPFKTGDEIYVFGSSNTGEGVEGKVIKTGWRSTRLRGKKGEEIILANKDLVNIRIKNMGERRGTRNKE